MIRLPLVGSYLDAADSKIRSYDQEKECMAIYAQL